jgi:hypothetical protein
MAGFGYFFFLSDIIVKRREVAAASGMNTGKPHRLLGMLISCIDVVSDKNVRASFRFEHISNARIVPQGLGI